MKKKTIGLTIAIVAVSLLLSAALSMGALLYIRNRNVKDTGNILGVSWYNETDKEFTINTAEELYEFASLSGFYTFEDQTVYLDADLILNEGNAEDWLKQAPEKRWMPIDKFAGTFDGKGHTISGLYAKAYEAPMALFTNTSAYSTVKNLKLVNSLFDTYSQKGVASFMSNGGGTFSKLYSNAIINHGSSNAGGIGSRVNQQATFDQCVFDGTLNVLERHVGGIIDFVETPRVTLQHCLFSGTLNQEINSTRTEGHAGGLVGMMDFNCGLAVRDSLATGKINSNATSYVGTVLGAAEGNASVSYDETYASYSMEFGTDGYLPSYTGGVIPVAEEKLLGIEGYRWTGLDFENYWSTVEKGTPVLKWCGETTQTLDGVKKAFDTSWYSSGKKQFVIDSVEDLYGFVYLSYGKDFLNTTVSLGADLVLNEGNAADWAKKAPDNVWNPISPRELGAFSGIFDGQGHTISGMYMNVNAKDQIGLFGVTNANSVIKNLRVVNSYIQARGSYGVGGIIGHAKGNVESVFADIDIDVFAQRSLNEVSRATGGIIGFTNNFTTTGGTLKVSDCWFGGTITAAGHVEAVGGIVGEVSRRGGASAAPGLEYEFLIEHCLFDGEIRSDENPTIEVEANESGESVGGLIGRESPFQRVRIQDCLVAGKLNMENRNTVGAVVGFSWRPETEYTITDTYALNSVGPDRLIGVTRGIMNGNPFAMQEAWMIGNSAYQYSTLDFKAYWTTVDKGTPQLRTFAKKQLTPSGSKVCDMSWYDGNKEVFTITNKAQLMGLMLLSTGDNFKGKTIKLGADIALNEGDAKNWKTTPPANEWQPIAPTEAKAFAGTFDGQGHTISGVYMNVNSKDEKGLFGVTAVGSMVKNLRVVNSYIQARNAYAVGGVIGHAQGDVENVFADTVIQVDAQRSLEEVCRGIGGVVGVTNLHTTTGGTQKVSNCWYAGKITAAGHVEAVGGIIGEVSRNNSTAAAKIGNQYTLLLEHCLFDGELCSDKNPTIEVVPNESGESVGGLIGREQCYMNVTIRDSLVTGKMAMDNKGYVATIVGLVWQPQSVYTITDTYALNNVGSEKLIGGVRGTAKSNAFAMQEDWMTGNTAYQYSTLDFKTYWTTVENGTPELRTFAKKQLTPSGEKICDFTWYDSNKDVCVIENKSQFMAFVLLSTSNNFQEQTIKLGADIVLNEGDAKDWKKTAPKNEWQPIAPTEAKAFAGTFDGQGHTISGMYMNVNSKDNIGLFGYTEVGSVVKNLRVVNSYIYARNAYGVGSIVGYAKGNVENVYADTIIDVVAQRNLGEMCRAIGGIVGLANNHATTKNTQKVSNCWYAGKITAAGHVEAVGGIVGEAQRRGGSSAAPGLDYTFLMEHCLFDGELCSDKNPTIEVEANESGESVGGLLGREAPFMRVTIQDCLVTGKMDMENKGYVATVVGVAWQTQSVYTITNTYALNSVGPTKTIGSIKGTMNGSVMSIDEDKLLGDKATTNSTLDFKDYWKVVDGGTPVLKKVSKPEEPSLFSAPIQFLAKAFKALF